MTIDRLSGKKCAEITKILEKNGRGFYAAIFKQVEKLSTAVNPPPIFLSKSCSTSKRVEDVNPGTGGAVVAVPAFAVHVYIWQKPQITPGPAIVGLAADTAENRVFPLLF